MALNVCPFAKIPHVTLAALHVPSPFSEVRMTKNKERMEKVAKPVATTSANSYERQFVEGDFDYEGDW